MFLLHLSLSSCVSHLLHLLYWLPLSPSLTPPLFLSLSPPHYAVGCYTLCHCSLQVLMCGTRRLMSLLISWSRVGSSLSSECFCRLSCRPLSLAAWPRCRVHAAPSRAQCVTAPSLLLHSLHLHPHYFTQGGNLTLVKNILSLTHTHAE